MADWLKILTGAALLGAALAAGDKTNKKQTNSGRKDLFGTYVCPYGKKDENGWTIGCDLRCRVRDQCTQRGRYK